MRESTHLLVGLGVSAVVCKYASCDTIVYGVALVSSILVNEIIDVFGHEHLWWQRYPRRIKITHSLFGVIAVSLIVTTIMQILLSYIGTNYNSSSLIFWAVLSTGVSHLVLDSFNPSGVYICGKRISFRVVRAGNPVANLLFQVLGVLLLCYGLCS